MPDKKHQRKLQDPKVVRRLAAALVAGATLSDALKQIGVSESTYYRELRRSPDLPGARKPSPAQKPTDAEPRKTTNAKSKGKKASRTQEVSGAAAPQRAPAAKASVRTGTKQGADEAPAVDQAPKKPKRARRSTTDQSAAPSDAATAGAPAAQPPPPAPAPPATTITTVAVGIEGPAVPKTPTISRRVTERPRLSRLVRDPYTIEGAPRVAAIGPRAPRRAPTPALSGADWMPPMIVLVVQLVVAVAVGANLLVIGLIVLTCLGLFVVVRRARRVAEPAAAPDAAVLPAGAEGESGGAPPQEESRAMDLRWIASSIVPSRRPPNDQNQPPRG